MSNEIIEAIDKEIQENQNELDAAQIRLAATKQHVASFKKAIKNLESVKKAVQGKARVVVSREGENKQ